MTYIICMIKTWLTHMIFDHCIDTLFDNIIRNFSSMRPMSPMPIYACPVDGDMIFDTCSGEWIVITYDNDSNAVDDIWIWNTINSHWISDNELYITSIDNNDIVDFLEEMKNGNV